MVVRILPFATVYPVSLCCPQTYNFQDGVLDFQFAEILSKGTGRLHGVDSSPSLIETSQKAVKAAATKALSPKVKQLPAGAPA